MSETLEQRKEPMGSQAAQAGAARHRGRWKGGFDVAAASPGAAGSGTVGARLRGGSCGEGMHGGILLYPMLCPQRVCSGQGESRHQNSPLVCGLGQSGQHGEGKIN